jgi:hypothetical protein
MALGKEAADEENAVRDRTPEAAFLKDGKALKEDADAGDGKGDVSPPVLS